MNNYERSRLIWLSLVLEHMGHDLVMSKLEPDTAGHWLQIMAREIYTNRDQWIKVHTIGWWEGEAAALADYMMDKKLPQMRSKRVRAPK